MSQTRGMAYLRRKLELKRSRVLTRYKYYEMKNAVKDFGMVTPPEFRTFSEVLGWCGKAVDSLAHRSQIKHTPYPGYILKGTNMFLFHHIMISLYFSI